MIPISRPTLGSARSAIGAALSCALALSCGTSELGRPTGTVRQAIAGGQVDEDEKWAGVLHIMKDQNSACSGTLVAPNLVLTALHCVAPLRDDNFECNPDGSITQNVPGAGELASPVPAEQIEIRIGLSASTSELAARGKQLFTTNSPNICSNDLALLVLDRELDLPVSRLRLDEGLVRGEPLTIVGYGMTSISGDLVTRRFIEDIRVVDLGDDSGENNSGGIPPRTILVEPSACKGDSGGPAYAFSEDDNPVVAGVDSIVVGTCGTNTSFSLFTRIAPFKKFILSAFEAAGYPAWEEGQLEPGVDPVEETPDAGVDEDTTSGESSDSENTARPQRLKTGCAIGRSNTGSYLGFGVLFGLALRRRRNTMPISLR